MVGLKDFQTLGKDDDSESVDFEFSMQCGHAMEVWIPVWGARSILNTRFNFSCTWALVYQKERVVLSVGREVQTWILLEVHLDLHYVKCKMVVGLMVNLRFDISWSLE